MDVVCKDGINKKFKRIEVFFVFDVNVSKKFVKILISIVCFFLIINKIGIVLLRYFCFVLYDDFFIFGGFLVFLMNVNVGD